MRRDERGRETGRDEGGADEIYEAITNRVGRTKKIQFTARWWTVKRCAATSGGLDVDSTRAIRGFRRFATRLMADPAIIPAVLARARNALFTIIIGEMPDETSSRYFLRRNRAIDAACASLSSRTVDEQHEFDFECVFAAECISRFIVTAQQWVKGTQIRLFRSHLSRVHARFTHAWCIRAFARRFRALCARVCARVLVYVA